MRAVVLDVRRLVLVGVVQLIEVSCPVLSCVTFLLQVTAIYSQGIPHGI